MWLKERKMVAVKHFYSSGQEVDAVYFDKYIIIASDHSFKYAQVSANEVNTFMHQFQTLDDSQAIVIEKTAQGFKIEERIMMIVPNPLKEELIFVCQSAVIFKLAYYRFLTNVMVSKIFQPVSIKKIDNNPEGKKIKSRLDRRQSNFLSVPHQALQFQIMVKNSSVYLLVVRQDEVLEIVENFNQNVFVEQIANMDKLLPSFDDAITIAFEDGSITQTIDFENLNIRKYLPMKEYYKQLAAPPKTSALHEIQKLVHVYQDLVIVNQSVFLLRDNIVIIYDTQMKQIEKKFFMKNKVLSLHKLRNTIKDNQGYLNTEYKVVAVHKNGFFQLFTPSDTHFMRDWQREEIQNSPIFVQQEQTNILFKRSDLIFIANSRKVKQEIIGVHDMRCLTLYQNDIGIMTRLYHIDLVVADFQELLSPSSFFYYKRDYLLVINKKSFHKINTRTNRIDTIKMNDQIQRGGNFLSDSQFCYFMQKQDQSGLSKLALISTDMIETSFQIMRPQDDISIEKIGADMFDRASDKPKKKQLVFNFPTWDVQGHIKKIDYDEYNTTVSLLLSSLEIIQSPLLHRNTFSFQNMGERRFYLAFKEYEDQFYALDKANYMNCWSLSNGQLLWRKQILDQDYSKYAIDRSIYDRQWYQYTVLHKETNIEYSTENETTQGYDKRIHQFSQTQKIIDINEKGEIIEIFSFVHPSYKNMDQHLYFNKSFDTMIEVLVDKEKTQTATYNQYSLPNAPQAQWEFDTHLNQYSNEIEWHHRSWFPYNLDLETLMPIENQLVEKYEYFKYESQNTIKALNTQDKIEMLIDTETGEIKSYNVLQYKFKNSVTSFYERQPGGLAVEDATQRLQNYYEITRKEILLYNKLTLRPQKAEISCKKFKSKYHIETQHTYFDLQFYEQFINNKKEKDLLNILQQMSVQHINRFVHNVSPGDKNTFLHLIASQQLSYECVRYLSEVSQKEEFLIPFQINSNKQTPLDIAVQNNNYELANAIVSLLTNTPLDHHSRLIIHQMPRLIDMKLAALTQYFDKRMFKTGLCHSIILGKVKTGSQLNPAVPVQITNDDSEKINDGLFSQGCQEQALQCSILDIPLQTGRNFNKTDDMSKKRKILFRSENKYELALVKALANSNDLKIFQQKMIRAFVDYLWTKMKKLIILTLLGPYIIFIFYFMIFLTLLKDRNSSFRIQADNNIFFRHTAEMFDIYEHFCRLLLLLGSFYFMMQDMLQIISSKGGDNPIVIWSYINMLPTAIMATTVIYVTFLTSNYPDYEIILYSLSAFLIWFRVIHLLKCFKQFAYLLRMGENIIYRMRYLLLMIGIFAIAFGFTFYYLNDDVDYTIFMGITEVIHAFLGNYQRVDLNYDLYMKFLFTILMLFNMFFIVTMIIAISVETFRNSSDGTSSNQAYQDKASMISLYSYLFATGYAIRDPKHNYLLVATVNVEQHKRGNKEKVKVQMPPLSKKEYKAFKHSSKQMVLLNEKFEVNLKEIQDRLDLMSDTQMRIYNKERSYFALKFR